VCYEPRALFAMQVLETLLEWRRQRTRWSRGLAQVLRGNASIMRQIRIRSCPLIYWMLSAAAAVRGTLPGLLRAPSSVPVTWKQRCYQRH
jgi:cellulose synthase/poly-beta-1,6-N-acetylglucosamine synthase-like glycosyltransferase